MSRYTFITEPIKIHSDVAHKYQVNYGTDRALGWWYDVNRTDMGETALADGDAVIEDKSTVFDNLFGFKMFLRLLELGCKRSTFLYYAMLNDMQKADNATVRVDVPVSKHVFETREAVVDFLKRRGVENADGDKINDFLDNLVGSSVLLNSAGEIIGYLAEEQELMVIAFLKNLGYVVSEDSDGNVVYIPKQEDLDEHKARLSD